MDAKVERSAQATRKRPGIPPNRVEITMQTAAAVGLTAGRKERRLSLRANERLVRAAQRTSGLEGSDLLEYALAKVALEDDYAVTLKELRGSVGRDVDLEF